MSAAKGRPCIALLRANLPRYFPEKHGVWARCESALAALCDALGLELFLPEGVASTGAECRRMFDACEARGASFVLLLHGGFTMGDVGREAVMAGARLGVWTVPEPIRTGDVQLNNFVSLNMTMSMASKMRDLRRRPVAWYHGAPESEALVGRLRTTLLAIKALHRLDGARIARVGGLAPTFHNMETSASAIRRRLGVQVDEHPMAGLQDRMAAIDGNRALTECRRMESAAPVRDVSDEQMDLTARCALALGDLALEGGYDALAVSDWPDLQERPGMHPGSAFSWLEETRGLPCASEGDILGAATQIAAIALGGRPGALLDMTEPDFDTGRLLMWHGGGGPLYMADARGATWINHPMIGREDPAGPGFGGVADFVFAPGPVSILRIANEATETFAMSAEIVPQEPDGFAGCRGWMERFAMDGQTLSLGDCVATVMASGVEHHFVALPGEHTDAFAEFGAWAGMTGIAPRRMRGHLDLADF